MSTRHPYAPAEVRFTHPADVDPTPEVTTPQIVAEICARLIEWGEVASKAEATAWLITCVQLAKESPNAMWLYVTWQTGDASAIAKSFAALGAEAALDKQGVHQATTKALDRMGEVVPELAQAMRELYALHRCESGERNNKRRAMRAREEIEAESI
jgi:hypothetical protein